MEIKIGDVVLSSSCMLCKVLDMRTSRGDYVCLRRKSPSAAWSEGCFNVYFIEGYSNRKLLTYLYA
jgi:hypothetical protein